MTDDELIRYDTALGDELVQLESIERALLLVGGFRDELLRTQGGIAGTRFALRLLKEHT